MMKNLWAPNTPASFWLCQEDISEAQWRTAIEKAFPILGISAQTSDLDNLPILILGEGQFGPDRWRLSQTRRLYYEIKPLLPRKIVEIIKCANARVNKGSFPLDWPIETRYVRFQWEVIRQLIIALGQPSITYHTFWPNRMQFAFVLTHDIETAAGQQAAYAIGALEEELGFRSSFNFVPEGYVLDENLIQHLQRRGFEIGIHGLRHDGRLFKSYAEFQSRAQRINYYLREYGAVGFRAPFMHRHPQWMQELDIEYDLSFFDTDPFEPLPGGVMSIWPFILGRFVELPYTLVQDSTLYHVLGETTPDLWLKKVDFLEQFHGLALLNTHPDYLRERALFKIYRDFLQIMKEKKECWHALPRDVACWWRERCAPSKHMIVEENNIEHFVL